MRGRGLALLAVAALVGALALAERRRPLRPRTTSRARRWAGDAALALSAAAPFLALAPAGNALARRRAGLVARLPLPPLVRGALAFLLLDWTFYLWHRASHRVGPLWALHRPHHADPDLDLATAVRFHPLELALSLLYRLGQVAVIGPDPRALAAYDAVFVAAVLFHHANVDLGRLDRPLSRIVVTPRVHGVHHGARREQLGSNWGVVLSGWDRLHGTFREEAEPPPIGLPDARTTTDPVEMLFAPLRRGAPRV